MLKKAIEQKEIDAEEIKNAAVVVPSVFEFLLAHSGLRPGKLHTIIGTMGCGKSSLAKRIAFDAAESKKTTFWLSEETVKEYQPGINKIPRNPECLPAILNNICFLEEADMPENFLNAPHQEFLNFFYNQIIDSNCELLMIDNATTSRLYSEEGTFRDQARSARFLSRMAKSMNIPIVVIAHTNKKITDNFYRIISPEDIRGPNTLPIISEFTYVMQKFTVGNEIYNFVNTAKFRGYEHARGWHQLHYDNGKYIGDSKVKFQDIKEIYKTRDRL